MGPKPPWPVSLYEDIRHPHTRTTMRGHLSTHHGERLRRDPPCRYPDVGGPDTAAGADGHTRLFTFLTTCPLPNRGPERGRCRGWGWGVSGGVSQPAPTQPARWQETKTRLQLRLPSAAAGRLGLRGLCKTAMKTTLSGQEAGTRGGHSRHRKSLWDFRKLQSTLD